MLALFLSIFVFTATVTTGILFFGIPAQQNVPESEKKVAPIISPTTAQTVYGIALSPTETITPTPTQNTPTLLPTVHITTTPSPGTMQKTVSSTVKKPTPTNSPLPTSTPKPTSTPYPTATSTQKTLPSLMPTALLTPFPTLLLKSTPAKGLNATKLFQLVNDYRNDNGLPSLQKDDNTCSIAQRRSQEVYDEIFNTDNMHAGLATMNIPYWITENIIYYNSEQGAFNWWIQDYIHRRVVLGNYKYSCTACFGYSCSQVFTSYIPK